MVFHTSNKHVTYPKLNINGNNIERVTNFNFSCLTLSSTLSWNQHINKISLKISKSIGILYRLRDIYPRAVLENLYNALIILHFNSCILCWGSVVRENHSLHILQKRALRLINNSNYISHTEHSVRFCPINLLNKDTCSATIMEKVDTDPFLSFKFYLKRQIFESYKNDCIIVNCHVCGQLKINDL